MSARRKLLYIPVKAALLPLTLIGAITCAITEACSCACDWLDSLLITKQQKRQRQEKLCLVMQQFQQRNK